VLVSLCAAVGASTPAGAGRAGAATGPFNATNGMIAVAKAGAFSDRLELVSRKGRFRTLFVADRDWGRVGYVSFSPSGSRLAYTSGWQPPRLQIRKAGAGWPRSPLRQWSVEEITWTSDRRIVFTGNYKERRPHTYVMRDNRTGLRKIFNGEQYASSFNRSHFIDLPGAERNGSHRIDLLDDRGRRIRTLDRGKAAYFAFPTFSPNGRWIAYVRFPMNRGQAQHGNIFIVRRDGTGRRQLTRGNRDRHPAFSPDGRWLAFERLTPAAGELANDQASSIHLLRLGRPGKVRRLTRQQNVQFSDISWGRRTGARTSADPSR
jgi:hypothetical protein